MKSKKKLSHKEFRYLTKKEFEDPLYAVADFCRSIISLSEFQDEIQKMIRVSSTSPRSIKPRKYSNLLFFWKHLVQQIELLYVLAHQEVDWTTRSDSEYYKLHTHPSSCWIYDKTLYNGSSLNFDHLKMSEIKDIGIFIKKFFNFKSLREWYKTMDTILETFFEEESLSYLDNYAEDQSKIFNYLEKLADATFLIYVTKAKEHIFKYHVKDFYLEKYLEKEEPEAEDNASERDISVSENPAHDAADDDA